MHRVYLILAICALAYALPQVRVSNDVSAIDPVDVKFFTHNDTEAGEYSVHFAEVSEYTALLEASEDNRYRISINAFDTEFDFTVELNGTFYTIVVVPSAHNDSVVEISTLEDSAAAPSDSEMVLVRFFHGADQLKPLEVLFNGEALIQNAAFPDATPYVGLVAGTYSLQVNEQGGEKEFGPIQVNFVGGTVVTLFGYASNGTDLRVVVHQDFAYEYSSVRIAHAAPQSPAFDVYLDDGNSAKILVASDVQFKGVTAYKTVAALNYTLLLTHHGEETPVFSQQVSVGQGVKTIAITHATDLAVTLFDDDNSPPSGPRAARLRFGQLSASLEGVDVYANGAKLFDDVAFQAVSNYAVVDGQRWQITVYKTGETDHPVLDQAIDVGGGQVYTLLAEGTIENETNDLSVVVSSDASYEFALFRAAVAFDHEGNVDFVLSDGFNKYPIATGVAFKQVTDYRQVILCNCTLEVLDSSSNDVIASAALQSAANEIHTIVALNKVAEGNTTVAILQAKDSNVAPEDGQHLRVRFIHAAPEAGAVSVKLADHDLFTDVPFDTVVDYKVVEPMTGDLVVSAEGKNDTLTKAGVSLEGGSVVTIILVGFDVSNWDVVVNRDVAFQYFSMRAAQSSPVPDLANVDIIFDDGFTETTVVPGLAYATVSAYKTVVAGNYTVKLSHDNQVFFSKSLAFVPASLGTLTILGDNTEGTANPLDIQFFADNNQAPSTGLIARIKLIHTSVNVSAIDVVANGAKVFDNLQYGTATPYIEAQAATYRVAIYAANTTDLLFTKSELTLEGGQVYTAITEGHLKDLVVANDATYHYSIVRVSHAVPDLTPGIDVLFNGALAFNNVSYGVTTSFQYIVNSGPIAVQVRLTDSDSFLLNETVDFAVDKESTLILAGNATELNTIVTVGDFAAPSGPEKVMVRVVHLSFDAPASDIYANGTLLFQNVQFTNVTEFKELDAGSYNLSLDFKSLNHSVAFEVEVAGGQVYSLFVEGFLHGEGEEALKVVAVVDYVPPPNFNIRGIHAAPETEKIDILLDGSADLLGLDYSTASAYISLKEGTKDVSVVPAGSVGPVLFEQTETFVQDLHYSFVLVGLQRENATEPLASIVMIDDAVLPEKDKIKIRFVHAAIGVAGVSLKIGDTIHFNNVSYRESTNYTELAAQKYTLTLLVADEAHTNVLFTAESDLRSTESAIYTVVAEGEKDNDKAPVKLTVYLDFGQGPPEPEPSPKKGLSGLEIGLIVGGSVLAVILFALIGFFVYRRVHKRKGYTTIPEHHP